MKRKVLSVLLALSMMLTLLPVTALAEETEPQENEPLVAEELSAPTETATEQPTENGTAPTAENVARIGETGYATLEAAVEAVQENDTIVVLQTCNDLEPITINGGKKVNLDLNSFDLNFKTARAFIVNGGTLNLVGNGTITAKLVGKNYNSALELTGSNGDVADYSVVTIGEGVTVKSNGSYGGAIFSAKGDDGKTTGKAYGAKLIVNGKIESTYGFSVNGLVKATEGTNIPEIIVNSTGVITGSSAIYGAGYANYEIKGQLIGSEEFGIEMRAGNLNVYDGATITCSAAFSNPAPNGNGSTVTGAAIAVSQHTTNLPINVHIMGGTISETGTNGYALYEIDTVKNEENENVAKGVSVTVDGGTFTGGVHSTNDKLKINGGTFSDLTSAVQYAADGATIKLANDVTLDQTISLNKDITIDLGGHTVSADTTKLVDKEFLFKSNADHVIIKNGSITAATCRGINVVSGEFTLENVQLSTFKRALAIDNASATVDKDSVISILKDGLDAPVIVWGTGDYKTDDIAHHPTVHVYGKVDATQAKAPYAAVQGNGTDHSYTYIYVYPGAELTSRGTGIYAPQAGEVHVSGGTVTGDGGAIGIKSGILDITGGVLKATDPYGVDIGSMSGGIETDGSVIVIDSNNAYSGEMKVNISGDAVLNSANGHVVREVGKADDQTSIVSLNIEGGNFISKLAPVNTRPITDNKVAVSGGTFAQDVDNKYIADDAAKATVTAADGTVKYVVGQQDIQKAVTEAGPNAQVDVTKGNVTLENVPQDTTVKNSGDGTVTANDRNVNPGSTITPNPKPSHSGGSSNNSHSGDYLVNVDRSKNGTVSVSPKWADKGDTVTITVKPDKGYELDKLIVTDKHGDEIRVKTKSNDKYTFTMPSGKVDVEAVFSEIQAQDLPFADVSGNAYYYDAVVWALKNGITSGVTPDTFQPYASCTRSQMVTFLWRAAGCPAPVNSVNPFTDVVPGAYYYDAVLWAVEKGITKGITDTTFQPNATVTRGQTVTFLYRYAGSPAAETATAFVDVASGSYCEGAVQWAVENGITNGTTNVTFGPADVCTRGQIVTFLYRFAK